MIGTEISHYKIIKKLGQGGMGHVYLAEDTRLGRKAAIKLLAPEFIRDETIKERFKREAQAVAALNHKNIVTIYEFGDYDLNPVLSSEKIKALQYTVKTIHLNTEIRRYIVRLIDATRNPFKYGLKNGKYIEWGASPRATISMFIASFISPAGTETWDTCPSIVPIAGKPNP